MKRRLTSLCHDDFGRVRITCAFANRMQLAMILDLPVDEIWVRPGPAPIQRCLCDP